jgi:hypothetical protein
LQLQLLFAHLQEGNKKFYDPTPFADQINIKTGVQQDAQEYHLPIPPITLFFSPHHNHTNYTQTKGHIFLFHEVIDYAFLS